MKTVEKKKILWISLFPPYRNASSAGSQTFYYYFSNFCKDSYFDITLVSRAYGHEKKQIEEELYDVKHNIMYMDNSLPYKLKKIINVESRINIFNRHGGLISNSDAHYFLSTIRNLKADGYSPDFIILEWTQCVVLCKEIKKLFPNAVYIASEHDVTFIAYNRRANYYQGIRRTIWKTREKWERKIELQSLALCTYVLPHNPDNIEVLQHYQINENKLYWLVPYFKNMRGINRNPNKKDILFFGAMSRSENYLSAIWFIENVMCRLSDLEIRFVVLGSNPPEQLKKYESNNIIITGYVNDIEPYFREAVCFVAPLVLGAGIKVKILEALSSGVPVITNAIGIEGIQAKRNVDYIHCESPCEYEKAIRDIIMGNINSETIGLNAKELLRKNYNIESSLQNYKGLLLK